MRLRVVENPPQEEDPFKPAPALTAGRPSDHRDPWTLESTDQLSALAAEARRLGVRWATAIALVIECRLLEQELGSDLASALDAPAHDVRLGAELAPGDAVYLRSLQSGADTGGAATVGLPARLATRILRAGGPDAVLAPKRLQRGLAWEIAAVAAGLTMSEWAFLAALELDQPVAAR
jgi:hypothetical protein